ncbi:MULTISPECIES: catechol 2,3-dioxygenase [Lysinibacillus]|uniref:Metapyrocatechase n=1 Tax=Lysinibacillus antri TaxID=2498145 RepID=A0A3S0PN88_9BACI|nr:MULTISPECIES: catechol 2,3-dioxygenase [Lysinibacillus]RUL49902.1 catechol 2,3-dioxygenase [Lysinibacillus antri]TSI05099.1 catechol 2,3-dioxygenase [Lysinibacillus sp. BW-2-10]
MTLNQEQIFDVAQLAHVELLSPKLEQSVEFFTKFLGMEVTARSEKSVYLRAYEDFYHNTLIITESDQAGVGHVAWRATSPQALERRVNEIEKTGLGIGWIEGDIGHGKAYRFTNPDGHLMEILWEVDYYDVEESQRSKLLNRPSKRPANGVPVRRLDHINLMTSNPKADTDFMIDTLGFRLREQIQDNGHVLGSWISVSNLVHEIAYMQEPNAAKGKLHHLCYWYGVPQNLYDVADLLKDHDVKIEVPPNKHGISQAFCMYVHEPGGNRIELFGDTGYIITDPAWKPVIWDMKDVPGNGDTWIGTDFPESWWTQGTPLTSNEAVKEEVL